MTIQRESYLSASNMAEETEELTLFVSFLRSETETSPEALENRVNSVSDFFERQASSFGIRSHELGRGGEGGIRVHRSGDRGARRKDHGDGLLYEAPFAEAKYTLTIERMYKLGTRERIDPYAYIYRRWCEAPPEHHGRHLDAWLSRGADNHLIDGINLTRMKDRFHLTNLAFGTVMQLTEFVPEIEIPCEEPKKDEDSTDLKQYMEAKVSFHHAYKQLNIFLTMHHQHQCGVERRISEYMLEVDYASIARAIVDLRKDEAFLYLRLTHPALLYSKDGSQGGFRKENMFKDFLRVNVLKQPLKSKCCRDVSSRLLGVTNTLRLCWDTNKDDMSRVIPNDTLRMDFLRLRLHSILSRLQRSESVIASMETKRIPRVNKEMVETKMKAFFHNEDISFRAKYAVEACKLISLDLSRQLAVLEEPEVDAFLGDLETRAKTSNEVNFGTSRQNETHKLLEKTMFTLMRAVDEGNVVMYQEAVPSQFRKFEVQERERRRRKTVGSDDEDSAQGMAIVYKVFLTPSRTILRPPEEHGENRILRQYNKEYMLRLAFRDDNLGSLTHTLKGTRGDTFLKLTVKRFLEEGISLANRTYEYLAASSSQLRDHGCWYYAKDDQGRDSASIRQAMGSFDEIKNVGKKMAREGLCFSSTIKTKEVPNSECIIEDDIKGGEHEDSKKPYTFSDGIGKISTELRDEVCEELKGTLKDKKPSAFQIRYQGAKGMVALDPTLKGRQLVLRKSMVKFECPPSEEVPALEVIKYSEDRCTTLNKQVITILEQLGVDREVFIHYQEMNIIDFADALIFERIASERLTASVKKDSDCVMNFNEFREFGISIIRDPYFRAMLLVLYKNIITNLRSKARIAIPWDLGRNLLGVMDETGKLEYGQVYIRYTVREDTSGPEREIPVGDEDNEGKVPETRVVTGKVVVTKCPCVHPGDVRMFEAVDVPELAHLVDVIVFPQKGERPHPNEMAGSDLDGDEYCAIWDSRFFFECECRQCRDEPRPDKNHKPMVFDDAAAEEQDNITLDDYYDFICKFIMTDNKGLVSNAHLAFADSEPGGIFSERCLNLAKKVSICLDFAKTGRLDDLEPGERPKKYPDFMEKQDHRASYCSQKVLGQMYRTCRTLENTVSMSSSENDEKYFCEFFRVNGWETMKTEAIRFVENYERRLKKIMEHMGIKSEAEIMVSIVNSVGRYKSNSFHEIEELQEQLERQRAYLNKRMKEDFQQMTKGEHEAMLLLASACYMIVYNPPNGEKYTDFYGAPWILCERLMEVRELNDDIRSSVPECPLADRLTEVIESDATIHDEKRSMKAMIKICRWLDEEGLRGTKGVTICDKCLYEVFNSSTRSQDSEYKTMDIRQSVGADVLLFIRFCAINFCRKTQGLDFSKCQEKCSMSKKEDAILRRMTTTAIGTYCALAVSGDICAIKGFDCGKVHTKRISWSAKLCSPLVLNVREEKGIDFFESHKHDIAQIMKEWCDADDDDRIEFDFKDSRGVQRVAVIVEAHEWTRHKLEARLYECGEARVLIDELKRELIRKGRYREQTPRRDMDARR